MVYKLFRNLKNINLVLCVIEYMLNQFRTILFYYRPFALWSFAVTIIVTIMNPEIIPAILTKLFLVILLWFLATETQAKQRLAFYNLNISAFKLFSILFLIDSFITVTFLLLIKGFI